MSLATQADARIDSRLAAILVAAVFSFALGIVVSLSVTQDKNDARASQPCPTRCPRLILMSTQPAVDRGDCMPIGIPAAYDTASLITAR